MLLFLLLLLMMMMMKRKRLGGIHVFTYVFMHARSSPFIRVLSHLCTLPSSTITTTTIIIMNIIIINQLLSPLSP